MYTVGTVCIKIAGRDAGNKCVVVEEEKDGYVLIDGAVRRKKCNVKHLEPTGDSVKIKKGASHAEVAKALGIDERKTKPKKAGARPRKVRKAKVKPETKTAKKVPKPEEKAPKEEPKAEVEKPKEEPAKKPKKKVKKKKAKKKS